uniref:Uncharacterized protein n=1 Tax=Panagrellus redivivus TaxID=6233 RepID=A0A7E4VB53_PANRE
MVAHDVALSATEHITVAVGRLSITIVAFVAVIVTSLFVDVLHVVTTIFEREKLGIQSKVCLLPVNQKKKKRKHKKKKHGSKSTSRSSNRKKPERSTQSTVSGNPDKSERFLKSVPAGRSKRESPKLIMMDMLQPPPTLAVPLVVQERDKVCLIKLIHLDRSLQKQANFDNPLEPIVPNPFPRPTVAPEAGGSESMSVRMQKHANQYQAKRRTTESVLTNSELYKTNKISQAKPTETPSSTFDESKIPEATTPPRNGTPKVDGKPGVKADGKVEPKSAPKSDQSAKMDSEGP